MAKTRLDVTDMFGDLSKPNPIPAQSNTPTAETQKQAAFAVEEKSPVYPEQVLQGKQGKLAKKEYDYGTKRTFAIPDDLWADVLILIQALGVKQIDFIQDLLRAAIEEPENAVFIKTLKEMKSTAKLK